MLKISHINFWDNFDPNNDWLTNFFRYHFGQIKVVSDDNFSDILISSCFGPLSKAKQSKAKIKIFYCAENLLLSYKISEIHDLPKIYDLQIDSLGDIEDSPRRIYMPMWMTYYNYYSFSKIDNICTYINQQRKNNFSKTKEYLASLVASHDKNGVRERIAKSFENHGKVHAPGKFMNNTHRIGKSIDSKINFISKSLFNICPENSYIHGYRSEKIIHALEAGTIPVYWGWQPCKDYLNSKCYIFHDCSSHGDELVDVAIKNPLKYLNEPIFNDEIDSYLEIKYRFLKKTFARLIEKLNY